MKMVKIAILAVHDGDVVSGSILKQRKRNNDYWVNEETITVNSNEPGAQRELLLDDDQRVIIEGVSSTVIIMDRQQSAAVRVPRNDPRVAPTPVSTDGEESPPGDVVARNMTPEALTEAQRQERHDAAITAARQKLAEDQKREKQRLAAEPPKEPEQKQGVTSPDPLKDSHQVKNEPTTADKPHWTPNTGGKQ